MRDRLNGYLCEAKGDKTPAKFSGQPAVLRAGVARVTSWVITRRRYYVIAVEGMVIKDVKEEAMGFGRGPGVGSRRHWEIVCLTD